MPFVTVSPLQPPPAPYPLNFNLGPVFIGVNPRLNGVFKNNSQNRHFVRKIPVPTLLLYIESNNSAAGGHQVSLAAPHRPKEPENDKNTLTKSSKSPLRSAGASPPENLD